MAGDKRTAGDLGAWLCFEDESGQGLRPPKGRTWGWRGHTPVVRVTGGSNSPRLSLAALIAVKPGQAPRLVYRTGPYAPNGIPFADGYADYVDMVNARDSGVGGVKITYEECEDGYNNDKGVECYERLKNKGPTGASLVDPLSTGITYALIERATADKIPVVSMGYGRADASYGAVFPAVVRFDEVPSGKPIAVLVNHGQHPESNDGYALMSF